MTSTDTRQSVVPTSASSRRIEPFHWLRGEVDRLFDDFARPARLWDWSAMRPTWPAIEIKDEGKQLRIVADVPGFDAKDIKVSVDGDMLAIRGTRSDAREREEDGMIVNERHHGTFERRIALPARVKPDGAKASLRHGVLTLRCDKADAPDGAVIPVEVEDNIAVA